MTIFHDYEGRYAMPEMEEASYYGVGRMLDIEKRHGVRTTYNVVGKLALDVPEVIRRLVNEGHEVAGHTFQHETVRGKSRKGIQEDLAATIRCFEGYGIRIRGMRAPKGQWNFPLMTSMADAGMTWSAEADGGTLPYYILPHRLVRFPVRVGDHTLYRQRGDPQSVLLRYEEMLDELVDQRGYAAFGFHPWVQAQSEDRLRVFDALIDRIAGDPRISVVTFANLAGQLMTATAS